MVDRFFEIIKTLNRGHVVVSKSFAKVLADDGRLQVELFDRGIGLSIEEKNMPLPDHLVLYFGPDGSFGFTDLRDKGETKCRLRT